MQLALEASATPEGKAKVEEALREALAVVTGEHCPVRCRLVARNAERLQADPAVAAAITAIAEAVGLANDHAEFLARRLEEGRLITGSSRTA